MAARHTVGQMLPDVVSGCLHQAIAGGVPAEGASSLWNPQIFGGGSLVDEVEAGTDANTLPEFSTVIFHCGGTGARPAKDGLSATSFPSGVRTIPVEVDRKYRAGGVPPPRIPRQFRRPRQIPRRARPGDRDRRRRRDAARAAVQFRAREESSARPRRRQIRRGGHGDAALRPADPAKGPSDRAAARRHPARAARRRRLRRSARARSAKRARRRARWA